MTSLKFNFNTLLKLLSLTIVYFSIDLNKVKADDDIDEDMASLIDDEEEDDEKVKKDPSEEIFAKLNVFRIRSEVELGYLTDLMDFAILQFYYVPHSKNSQIAGEEIFKLNKRIEHLGLIAAINCEEFTPEDFKHCKKNEYNDAFPRIRLFVPPEKRYNYEEKKIKKHLDIPFTEKEITEKALFNFMTVNTPNRSQKLDSYSIVPFLDSDSMNKIILFTNKHYPGVMFRGLTNNYYDKILFGTVHSSETDLIKKYNITTFPTLMAYRTQEKEYLLNEPEIEFFTGNPNNVQSLVEFMDKYQLQEKRYISHQRGIPEPDAEDLARKFDFMEIDKANFLRFFEKYQHKKIMVLFHTKNKLKMSVKKYLFQLHGAFLNVFLNCKGEKDFCSSTFGVNEYPTVRLYEEHTFNMNLESFGNWKNYTEFDVSTNTTFLEDASKYLLKKQMKFSNTTDFNFRYVLGDTKEKRKLGVVSFQDPSFQSVRF